MKKIVLLFAALFAVVAANAATVYFENTGNWSAVCAHMWGGTGGDTTWPGKNITTQKITATNGTTYYYVETTNASIIFDNNNAGQQTLDLTVSDGAVFSYAKNGKGVSGSTIDKIGTIAKSGDSYVFTAAGAVELTPGYLYFPVETYDHPTAYLYTWNPGITADWPGDKLTKTTLNDIEFWKWETNDVRNIEGKTIGGVQLNTGDNTIEVQCENVAVNNNYYIDIKTGQSGPVESYVSVGGGGGNTGGNYDSWWVNIFGDWNDGDNYNGGVQPKNNIVTMNDLAIGNSTFGIKTYDGTDVYWTYSSPIPVGTPVTLTNGGGDYLRAMTVEGATAGSTYNLEFNVETKQLTLTAAGDVPVVYPETMYVIGNVDGTSWDPSKGVTMEKTGDGVFTAKFDLGTDSATDNPGFSFTSKLGSDANDWDGISAYRYGTGGYGDDTEISAGGTYNCASNSNPGSYYMAAGKYYTVSVTVDLTTSTMSVNSTTGVENVELDTNAPVEYFNLQGVRVANPENGVFIRIQNGKAVKVLK